MLLCLYPGRAAVGRWLSYLLFRFGVSHKWSVCQLCSPSLAVVLGHCPPQSEMRYHALAISLGIAGKTPTKCGVLSTPHVPPCSDSLGLHLSQGMEMSFKNTGGSKNLLKLINECILLRLEVGLRWSSFFLQLVEGLVSIMASFCPLSHGTFQIWHSHMAEGAGKQTSLQNPVCLSVPSVNTLSFLW